MNQQHTPGPWATSSLSNGTEWTVSIDGGDMLADLTGCPNEQANARLIAAAPELFAALEQAYYSLKLAAVKLGLDESTEFYKDIDAAYRALQKAKGEPA